MIGFILSLVGGVAGRVWAYLAAAAAAVGVVLAVMYSQRRVGAAEARLENREKVYENIELQRRAAGRAPTAFDELTDSMRRSGRF